MRMRRLRHALRRHGALAGTSAFRGIRSLLANFEMSDGQWESLLIPINMAFFFRSSIEGRMIALYPSPAGAVESSAAARSMERDCRKTTRRCIGCGRTSKRIAGKSRGPCAWHDARRVLYRAHRRVLQTRGPHPRQLEGVSRAERKSGLEIAQLLHGNLRTKSEVVTGGCNA
jgi:hypothetical protein